VPAYNLHQIRLNAEAVLMTPVTTSCLYAITGLCEGILLDPDTDLPNLVYSIVPFLVTSKNFMNIYLRQLQLTDEQKIGENTNQIKSNRCNLL